MANRRMIAKTIIDSDAFLDMPQSTQLLYLHLNFRADDDGFLNNAKSIMRNIGAKDDDLKLLAVKKFIIPFESGVVVIKHWKIHNYIAADRRTPTKYKSELAMLNLDENSAYSLSQQEIAIPYTECIQDVYETDTQVRLGKVRLGKVRLGKGSKEKNTETYEVDGMTIPINLTTHQKLIDLYGLSTVHKYYTKIIDYVASGKKRYADYSATARQWIQTDIDKGTYSPPKKTKEKRCPVCDSLVPGTGCNICGLDVDDFGNQDIMAEHREIARRKGKL